jgi:putative FmdB family regulatory protein
MPTYEYRCRACGKRFELIRPRAARTQPATCPACGAEDSQLLVSACHMRSRSDTGATTRLGGSSCASCRATSCASCSLG